MPDLPKIVPHRLRTATVANALAATHPEADALTAFIEQMLSPSEREGVLQHLALCADCREAVVLALPAMDEAIVLASVSEAEAEEDAVVAVSRSSTADGRGREAGGQENENEKEQRSRFRWPSFAWTPLRWATLAASVALAVLVVRPALERRNEKPNASFNSARNSAPAPAERPAAESQIASNVSRENAMAGGAAKNPTQGPVNGLANNNAKIVASSPRREDGVPSSAIVAGGDEQVLPDSMTARHVTNQHASPSIPGMQLADNKTRTQTKDDSKSETVEIVAGGSLKEPSPDSSTPDSSTPDSNTTAQNIATYGATSGTTPGAQNDEVIVQSAPAVVKSKPPLPMNMAASRAAIPKQSATWTITQGVLQRSVDGGQTWQTAARADHPLLCFASRGLEMWAGGEAGTLLHSNDGGATWSVVAMPLQGQPLDSAVIHIDVHAPAQSGAAEIVLSTADHQTLISVDGGKTWTKK
jgi:hypothetical protein